MRKLLHLLTLILVSGELMANGVGGSALICSGYQPPPGMVVTASGTAPACEGWCRAREIEPVHGAVMTICAGQRIPDGYQVVATESTPACECLGHSENAYVIRRDR